jgi:rubrerythrin
MSAGLIAPENEVTVKNLLNAFERESNLHAKYTAYAGRAVSEGLHRTVSLFRALAHSEQVQADNHAGVIRGLGGDPKAHVQTAEVKTTLENLTAALEDASGFHSIYSRFLVENRISGNRSAARVFIWALEAKKTHVRLLREEIRQLQAGTADPTVGSPIEFYVRPVCGYVSCALDPERCWVCNSGVLKWPTSAISPGPSSVQKRFLIWTECELAMLREVGLENHGGPVRADSSRNQALGQRPLLAVTGVLEA